MFMFMTGMLVLISGSQPLLVCSNIPMFPPFLPNGLPGWGTVLSTAAHLHRDQISTTTAMCPADLP
jgi:hypothetical protein